MNRKSRNRSQPTWGRRPYYRRIEFYAILGGAILALVLIPAWFFPKLTHQLFGGNSPPDNAVVDDVDVSPQLRLARERIAQGVALNHEGEFELAADCFREALDLAPEEHTSHFFLMLYHEEKTKQAQQADVAEDIIKHVMMSGFHARQLVPYLQGMSADHRGFVLEAIYNSSKGAMLIDEKPLALATLKLAIENGFNNRRELETEPIFDPVRSFPEFQQLLQLIKPQ